MNQELPLISLVIPVYNAENYLHRCLDSVRKQDYPHIEVVLIDDGSTDWSPAICDEYAETHANIVVKHIPNSGASLARKEGVELAKGELLTFVDSDDYVAPNYVRAMYEAMQRFGTHVAGCGMKIVSKDEQMDFVADPSTKLLEEEELFLRFFNYEFWGFWGGLYDRSMLTQSEFPKATLSEDYFVKTQIFLRDSRMALVDAPLYAYEKHEGSLSNTHLSIRAFEEFENVKQVYDLVNDSKPQHAALALKNVVETCVKLLLMGTDKERSHYKENYKPIHFFLRTHTREIFANPYILKNVKALALTLRFFPWMSNGLNFVMR